MSKRQTHSKKTRQASQSISDDDRSLFRDAVGQTRPVTDDRVRHQAPEPRSDHKQIKTRHQSRSTTQDRPPAEVSMVEAGEPLRYLGSGVQPKMLKRLRRGDFDIGAELDLHQMTAETARINIDSFIDECHMQNVKCIRIIHGKGLRSGTNGPVLKNLVNSHLRVRSEVLAFVSAPPNDGGTGAVYALLKTGQLSQD